MRVLILILLLCLGCQSNQSDSGPMPETKAKSQTGEPVVRSENKGPCACCGGGTCCFPSSCSDLSVTITDTGIIDGSYTATWSASDTAWTFDAGGCTWLILADSSSGGISTPDALITYDGPAGGYPCFLAAGPCSPSGGVAMLLYEYSPCTDSFQEKCGFDAEHTEGLILVTWPCRYPRLAHVVADYTNADCDNCDELNDLEIPIDCDNTSFPDLAWKVIVDGPEGCSTEVSLRYYCDLKSLVYSDPDASFIKTDDNVSLSDIINGGPIVLDLQVSPGSSRCNDPTSITVTFSDNGNWCP